MPMVNGQKMLRRASKSAEQSTTSVKTPPSSKARATTPSTVDSTPDRREETLESPLPDRYILLLTEAFGPNVDLYQDVLGVSRSCTPAELRIAYFRRGRQVLAEPNDSLAMDELSTAAKKRFQAVSMAYEILTTDELKEYYDRHGLSPGEAPAVRHQTISPTPSDASSSSLPILRRPNQPKVKSTSRNIRWSEEVEELLYKQDPDEIGFKTSKKAPRKVKKRVILEAQELTSHLEELDKQAQPKSFVSGFLDDIEASLDGIEASVEEFVRFAMSEGPLQRGDDGPTQAIGESKSDNVRGLSSRINLDEDDESVVEEEAATTEPAKAPLRDRSTPSSTTRLPSPVAPIPTPSSRVSALVPNNRQPNRPNLRGAADSDEDAVNSLFADLTKPPPPELTSRTMSTSDSSEVESVTEHAAQDQDTSVDLARQLFAALTLPPSANAIEDAKQHSMKPFKQKKPTMMTTLPSKPTSSSSVPRPVQSATPKVEAPKDPVKKTTPAATKQEDNSPWMTFGFDPFDLGSQSGGTFENIDFEDTMHSVRKANSPPHWVVPDEKEVDDGSHTISTMSESETTEFVRERLLHARASSLRTARTSAPVKGLQEAVTVETVDESKAVGDDNEQAPALDDDMALSALMGDIDGVMKEVNDPNNEPLKFDRTGTGVSSLTGYASYTAQHEQALRSFCKTTCQAVGDEENDDGPVSTCSSSGNDQDFVSRFFSFVKGIADDVSKVGSSMTGMIESIKVPEEDVDSILNVLSQEMESQTGDQATTTTLPTPAK